ncbi:MAG: DUF4065 domain-containing protein [Nitrospiraceae bacterium]|nr:MAG: DUF4065 domain-containing protein [Nitrospiraceae bacterium]
MIKFKFNEKKATQATALLLKNNDGKMNYMKLIKLLYLIDREALSLWERPITGDTYVSMKRGPVLSNVLDLINYGENVSSYWYKYISEPLNYELRLRECDPGQDLLNEKEIEIINQIGDQFKDFNQWEMVELCHEMLPEWRDPGTNTCSEIHINDIFNAIRPKSDEELKEIEEEVNNLAYLKEVLAIED